MVHHVMACLVQDLMAQARIELHGYIGDPVLQVLVIDFADAFSVVSYRVLFSRDHENRQVEGDHLNVGGSGRRLNGPEQVVIAVPRLGPPDIPEKPSKETMDEIAKMFPKLAPEGFVEPDNKTIGPCFPGPFDHEDPDSGTFVIEEPKEDINREGGPVNHPKHYNSHPSGIECIVIARWYDFDIGNAIKYIYRHGLKHDEGKEDIDKTIEDLEKAIWYIKDEISMLEQKKKDQQAKCG